MNRTFGAIALLVATCLVLAGQPPQKVVTTNTEYVVLVREERVAVATPTGSTLTPQERLAIEQVVEGEARGSTFESKVWVASCIYNSMKIYRTDALDVLRNYDGYNKDVQPDTQAAVYRVFDLNSPIHPRVQYFYAPSLCRSDWHESLTFVTEIGGHRYFEANRH